ncbi:MAG TPA: PEGA domain-containing protein [Vicinamibacterales bacterium]|nr:PEGA domain-containing protein [Vicinamibacterales bacterium]
MPRTFRLGVLLGLFVSAGLVFPSVADAQRRGGGGGGGGARGGGAVRPGGPAGRGGAVYRGSHVAVPRTHPPYYGYGYRPYYSHASYYRPYYYRPYYSGYYPYYYSPWSFSLGFGIGWYGGYSAPSYPYPYPYPYPYASPNPAYSYPSANPDSGYNTTLGTPSRGDERGEFGTLSLRVMPSDATILIDGQAWDRPRGDERFSIEVAEGSHHVELRKAGYTTYVRTIDVPRGRSVVLNVALTPGGSGTMQVARTVPFRH